MALKSKFLGRTKRIFWGFLNERCSIEIFHHLDFIKNLSSLRFSPEIENSKIFEVKI